MEHSKEYNRRVKERIRRRRIKFAIISIVLVVAIALGVFACSALTKDAQNGGEASNGSSNTQKPQGTDSNEPTEPYVVSTASVGSTGDILIHEPVLSNAKQSDGSYNFTNIVPQIKSYFSAYDYMVANLEVTCGGTEAGKYAGYPVFNTPDSIIDAFKIGGVDMFLTANNHTYDTGYSGMLRTINTIKKAGVDYLGTRLSEDEPLYAVKNINGIKIGFAVYTYETGTSIAGRKALNGNVMKAEAGPLVSSFNYNKLDEFYATAKSDYEALKAAGAEAVIYYIHWGNEYQRTPNSYQTQISQKLADIGVDVIVGGHPHVIQPFDTLTGVNGNETVCIYSMGNCVSNQRKEIMDSDNYSGHTEDGMIFGVTFQKWSDGKIEVTDVNILPTWVNMKRESGKRIYEIVPLDVSISDWSQFGLSGTTLSSAKASYNRTMKLVGEGLNEYRNAHGLTPVQTVIE